MNTVLRNGVRVPYVLSLNIDPMKNNWVLELTTTKTEEGLDLAESFKNLCYQMPKNLHWFHQGGCLPDNKRSEWHMFEFWINKTDPAPVLSVHKHAAAIANEMGLAVTLYRSINREELDEILTFRG